MTAKRVDDLTTDEINEQVALCQGWYRNSPITMFWRDKNGKPLFHKLDYEPCNNAQQAFEIIEREKINLSYKMLLDGGWKWVASCDISGLASDDSLLISAMRCYVKSVKGEEVEV